MSNRYQTREKFRRPELILGDLLKSAAKGHLLDQETNVPFLFRAIVLAVDTVGGQLENATGTGTVSVKEKTGSVVSYKATVGPKNPKNSIKAKIISDGFDQFFSKDEIRTFWPFFGDHLSFPIKQHEHVYVFFEDKDFEHGLWLTKVSGHENLNFFNGTDSFTYKRVSAIDNFDDSRVQASERFKDEDYVSDSSQKQNLNDLFGD